VVAAALARAALAEVVPAFDRGASVSEVFNYLPAESLTVKKFIAEQARYESRDQSNGSVPQNIAKIISNRRPVALNAYLLARIKFKSSQREVEDCYCHKQHKDAFCDHRPHRPSKRERLTVPALGLIFFPGALNDSSKKDVNGAMQTRRSSALTSENQLLVRVLPTGRRKRHILVARN
jgi:hypothetical protein